MALSVGWKRFDGWSWYETGEVLYCLKLLLNDGRPAAHQFLLFFYCSSFSLLTKRETREKREFRLLRQDHLSLYIYTHTYISHTTHTHTYIHIHTYVYMQLCTYIHVCIYTHKHTLYSWALPCRTREISSFFSLSNYDEIWLEAITVCGNR